MPDNDELEFEVIEAYTRAQAIADGTLMEVTSTAREMGIKLPVAVTHSVWARYVMLTPAALRARNDERGRLWDVLWMFRAATQRAPEANEITFSLYVVTDSTKPSLVELKAVCGPGDNAEPVITIMLPEED
ncbi:DUF6573 family protein [Sorangium sp. So ce291]|uniref:DUF6573 family protein n=1 Tax=Sorangium sp. So ce291 TaxID=3133294 RepID=UPI003F64633A